MRKRISYFSVGMPSGWTVSFQGRLFLQEFSHQERPASTPSWKHCDQIQTRSVSLLIVVNYAVLRSLLRAGKRESEENCELSLLALQQECPRKSHPSGPSSPPLLLLMLSVLLAEWERVSVMLIWGAERETQPSSTRSSAVLPLPWHQGKDDFLEWLVRKREGKFTFLFLLWNRQIYTGPTETERCFFAHLKLQSKEISWSLAPSIGGNFHPAYAIGIRASYEVEQFLVSFPERLLGTSIPGTGVPGPQKVSRRFLPLLRITETYHPIPSAYSVAPARCFRRDTFYLEVQTSLWCGKGEP